ncbi:hypothetical protein ANO14919_052960 [Xylariales sp. No.14919]|nr:hypothetical protein ANO14919_052960 [Xylariales sp. No.14919]
MSLSTGNFAVDFPVAIGIAAGATIAATILICTLAHFGPRLCGFGRKDRWFASDAENGRPHGGDLPLMMPGEGKYN